MRQRGKVKIPLVGLSFVPQDFMPFIDYDSVPLEMLQNGIGDSQRLLLPLHLHSQSIDGLDSLVGLLRRISIITAFQEVVL